MGTNYYVIHKKTNECVHLGKSSGGWVFFFQTSKYYEPNKKSINRFLKLNQPIIDEYDDNISILDFWELVESKKGLNYFVKSCYITPEDSIHNEEDDLWFYTFEFS